MDTIPQLFFYKVNVVDFFFFNINYYLKPNIYLVAKQVKPAIIDLPVDQQQFCYHIRQLMHHSHPVP